MSSMEIYGVRPDGDVEFKFRLANSWRGAAMVWTKLGEKYFGKFDYMDEIRKRDQLRREGKDPDEELGPYDPIGWSRTWKLKDDPRITDYEWCVLLSTFDNCIIETSQFDYVAACFEKFDTEYPGHYGECAKRIRELKDGGYIGYCTNATSVNENPWWVRFDDEDEGRAYNINVDEKHWFFDPSERK